MVFFLTCSHQFIVLVPCCPVFPLFLILHLPFYHNPLQSKSPVIPPGWFLQIHSDSDVFLHVSLHIYSREVTSCKLCIDIMVHFTLVNHPGNYLSTSMPNFSIPRRNIPDFLQWHTAQVGFLSTDGSIERVGIYFHLFQWAFLLYW